MKTLRRLLLALAALVALVGVAAPRGLQLVLRRQRRHGLRALPRDPARWSRPGPHSTHRDVSCKDCHGSSFTAELRMHAKNLRARVAARARRDARADPHPPRRRRPPGRALRRAATARSTPTGRAGRTARRTRRSSSTRSTTPAQQLMDDCLRCHAHALRGRDPRPGRRRSTAKGPWTFVRKEYAGLPAVPCLACHAVHRDGEPFAAAQRARRRRAAEQEIARPSLALYDRRALEHVGLDRLPLPAMRDGEAARRHEPGPPPGALLPVPRAAGGEPGRSRATTARRSASTRA